MKARLLATPLWVRAALPLILLGTASAHAAPPPGGKLRWGGDKSGGAPYIIEENNRLTGFEVELADYLANKLGLEAEFVHKSWEMLPQDLERGDVDIILNGYEWSSERERQMASTIPYYIYRLSLIARRNDESIRGWNDLRRKPDGKRKRVGVLKGSAAERYLNTEFGNDVEVEALGEDGVTGAMAKVGTTFDATVQDEPAALYYLKQTRDFDELHTVGEPAAPGYYVIFVPRNEPELRDRLNAALRDAMQDGTLRRIYEKWGLWNAEQERLPEVAKNWPPELTASSEGLFDYAVQLTRAAGMTVLLSFASMPLAMLIGLLVAVGRLYGPRWLDVLLTGYVELLRGTPLLLQLTVIYYFLPTTLGLKLDAFTSAVIGLVVNYSAYEAENYRAGLLAIPKGQMEAALALGMGKWTALRRIIIPQAVRIVIPPVTNDFIALFKDTSVCSVIAVKELTGQYRELMVGHPRLVLELGLMTALLYLLMSYPLSLVARRLERRFPRVVV